MTETGGFVRLLTSRSQHVSWARLGSSEVTKGMIVPFDPSSFSAIERLPLPLSAGMKNVKTFHCLPKQGFYNTFHQLGPLAIGPEGRCFENQKQISKGLHFEGAEGGGGSQHHCGTSLQAHLAHLGCRGCFAPPAAKVGTHLGGSRPIWRKFTLRFFNPSLIAMYELSLCIWKQNICQMVYLAMWFSWLLSAVTPTSHNSQGSL